MTYAAAVTAPVLVIAGENDPRCPLEGVLPWVDAVRARGVDVDLQLYRRATTRTRSTNGCATWS